MRISQARIEVLLEELELDIIDYLRCQVGEINGRGLHRTISNEITNYLADFDEIDNASVVCNDANNSPTSIESGRLQVDVYLLIDSQRFPATFLVRPSDTNSNYTDITGVFKQPTPAARTLKASWSITSDDIDETQADVAMFDDASGDERCPCVDCQAYYKEQANFMPNLMNKMAEEISAAIDEEIFKDLSALDFEDEIKSALKVNYFNPEELSAPPEAKNFTQLDLNSIFTKKPSIYAEMPAGLASTLGL